MNTDKTKHYFRVEDAINHGVDKATVLSNLRFWLSNNKDKDVKSSKHDGYYWVYNTSKDLSEVMPYFSPSKVQRLLKQLEDDGVIISGNYNKVKYDRTKWYTLPEYFIVDISVTQDTGVTNGTTDSVEPIPINITDNKNTNKTIPPDTSVVTDNLVSTDNYCNTNTIPFDVFWELYDYKKGMKSTVAAKWESLSLEEQQATIDYLPAYKDSTPDKAFRKFPMSFLNLETWNDEIVTPQIVSNNANTVNTPTVNTAQYDAIFSEHSKRANGNNNISNNDSDVPFGNSSGVVCGNTNNTVDMQSFANTDNIPHWWDMKNKNGIALKTTRKVSIDADTSQSIDDFLSKHGSRGKLQSSIA